MQENFWKIHRKIRKFGRQKYNSSVICHNIFLYIVTLLLVMNLWLNIIVDLHIIFGHNSKSYYNLVKMLFLTLNFRLLSREPTYACLLPWAKSYYKKIVHFMYSKNKVCLPMSFYFLINFIWYFRLG